jgi:kynurenine formamidase
MAVIDLTHPVSERTPVYFPWHPRTEVEQTATYRENHCVVRRITIGTHSGTHIDAPSHIFEGMPDLDAYDPSLWIREARVLDMTPRQPKQPITADELRRKRPVRGMAVIIKTGWDERFGEPDFYATYPPLTVEAAEYLVEIDVPLVASDTPYTLDVHKVFLKHRIPLVTNINNTRRLREGTVTLISAPLLIAGGDGAPARVLAVVPD